MTYLAASLSPADPIAAGPQNRPQRRAIPPGRLLIGGTWRDAAEGATTTTCDPTTEQPITTVAKGGAA